MIKFLKLLLFIVIVVFAFTLGVKFSDSFKTVTGNLQDDEMNIKQEIDKAFNDTKEEIYKVVNRKDMQEETPLSEEEKEEVKNIETQEFNGIDVAEPMAGITEEIDVFVEDTQPQQQEITNNAENTAVEIKDTIENVDNTNSVKQVKDDISNIQKNDTNNITSTLQNNK